MNEEHTMEDFDRLKVIGKGSYGEVWLAKHKKDKKQYVLKRINLQRASKRERTSAEQEARLLQKLKHPNIVSYKQSFETVDGMLYIAMQYCEGGDLYTKLKEQKGQILEERQVVEWFVQIAMALQYMHERNILHRDLKTQNIFLTKSKIIKVGDLGIAKVLDGATDMATTLIGTPYYMSPELFSNKPYNHKSDVWALGCCVYEMTTLKHAFNAKDMNSLVYKILKGKLPPMPHQYGPELLALMRIMLHQDPEKRPSVNRLLRDPYIKRNIARFLDDTRKQVRPRQPGGAAAADRRPGSASSSRPSPASTGASAGSQANSSNASSPKPPAGPAASSSSGRQSASASEDSKASDLPPRPSLQHASAERRQSASAVEISKSSDLPPRPSLQQASAERRQSASAVEISKSSDLPPRPSLQQASAERRQSASAAEISKSSDLPPRPSLQQASAERRSVSSSSEEPGASDLPPRPSLQQVKAEQKEKENSERDEVDSSSSGATPKNAPVNSSGDAPAFKPGHARRPSDLAPKELEPIKEDGAGARDPGHDTHSDKEDASKPSSNSAAVKEVKEPPAAEEGKKRKKKKKKLLPSRPGANSQASKEKEAAEASDLSARNDISSAPKSDRPLSGRRPLPVPKVEVSEGLPQKREPMRQQKKEEKAATDSTSSKSSSDGVTDETPRSLPNLSARDRRRREKAGNSMETPPSARNVKLRRVPERAESEKVTRREKTVVPKRKMVADNRQRQPSIQDSSSSDESMLMPEENTQEREKRRQNKEMDNFICLLDNTLRMNNAVDKSDEEELREVPLKPPSQPPNGRLQRPPLDRKHSLDIPKTPAVEPTPTPPPPVEPAPVIHKSSSMPSVETLTCTSRLMDRIRLLQKDCVRGVGYPVLKKAYDILDKIEEDEVEPKLMDLLGKEKFDEYAGKIWQLKFCEESLFMAS